MTSLAELRAIEDERVAMERAAVVADAEARQRARELADRQARDAEAARLAAIHDEALQLARERERAEREARMHVEATEAAERARLAHALDQERLAHELDLRRQEVARKRPTWMVAVTIGAVLAAGALTWLGYDSYQKSQAANAAQDAAEAEAKIAKQQSAESSAALAKLKDDLSVLDTRVASAVEQLGRATTRAQQEEAKRNFDRLSREQAEVRARIERERIKREKEIRDRGHHMSQDCLKNAVC